MIKSWTPEAANRLLFNLPPEEQAKIVEYGAMLRLADLRKRLSHAESNLKELSAKYHTTLEELDRDGLPEDAGYEMHEDYILWHHYIEQATKVGKQIKQLEEGLDMSERTHPHAG